MGRDKGLLDFGGDPLIVHTARLLQPLVTEVTVVGSPSRYAKFGLHGIEPLAAVYRHECGDLIAAALEQGIRKISEAIEKLRMALVYSSEWRRFDPSGLVLRNMNAPRDYEEARKWWATARSSEIMHVRKPSRPPKRRGRSAPRRSK